MIGEGLSEPRNFAAIPPPYSDLGPAKVAVLPVAYDATSEWESGSRNAPKAIIDASQYLEWYDLELECELHQLGIHTLPEILPDLSGPPAMVRRIQEIVGDLLKQDKFVVTLGGEHTLTLGAVKAFRGKFPRLSVLQLDAHADLRDSYLGTSVSQATVMRRVSELCTVVPVGIRSLSLEERDFMAQVQISPFYADQLRLDKDIPRITSALSEEVYITIDLDVLDPSIMPAVGTPEPGGLGWKDLLALLRAVARSKKIVGFDVVELCPGEGARACTFLAAKLVYKLIGYCFFK